MKRVLEREGERLKLELADIRGRFEHAGALVLPWCTTPLRAESLP